MSPALIEKPLIQTADSLISLINENDIDLLKYTLDRINEFLPLFWPELYESTPRIQHLACDPNFIHAKTAALTASKIFFYASDLDQALDYALLSENMFDPYIPCEFNQAITYKCFERYIKLRQSGLNVQETSPRLHYIVFGIIDDAIEEKNYLNVLGLAIEMRSIETLEKAIISSGKDPQLLSYCVDCVGRSNDLMDFRKQVIHKVLTLYSSQANHSLVHVAKYLYLLDDRAQLIELLKRLIYSDPSSSADLPVALQICFDLFDNCPQNYLINIIADLQTEASMKTAELIETGVIDLSKSDGGAYLANSGEDYKTLPYLSSLHKLVSILDGTEPNKLELDFMVRSLKYDAQSIINMQKNARYPTPHTGTSICNAIVHLGTTSDTLIRTNVEWITWSSGWGRFIMVSSLGIIHKSHGKVVVKILKPFLPGGTYTANPYHEGGALYGVGLACANCGSSAAKHIVPHLIPSTNPIILHGACLGIGLASMGSWKNDISDSLHNIVKLDEAVSGEASGLAYGLVMLGSGHQGVYDFLRNCMLSTKHEKLQRGVSLGIAMLFASKAQEANVYIEELLDNRAPISRISGVYTIALAYAGSNDPYAVKKLWRIAASDTNDDVRRASMIALGLVMFREPEKFLGIALLYIHTYNPHLRCGALMAIGIVFAGSGNDMVVNLLKSMFVDTTLIVRQAAFIACAMVLVQRNEKTSENYRDFKSMLTSLCTDRHSDTIAKFGAYISYGILDAGGRNQTLTFKTLEGHTRYQSVAGIVVALQFWYWFPFIHFISLCFVPTSIILVNPNLEMLDIKFVCDADLSLFAYPSNQESHKRDVEEKVRSAQLSQTIKSRVRRRNINLKDHDGHIRSFTMKKSRSSKIADAKANASSKGILSAKPVAPSNQTPSSDEPAKTLKPPPPTVSDEPVSVEVTPTEEDSKESKPSSSGTTTSDSSQALKNPVRALPRQLQFMRIHESCLPLETVKPVSCGGIIVCYTENEIDEFKLKKLSTSDKKPMEEYVLYTDNYENSEGTV